MLFSQRKIPLVFAILVALLLCSCATESGPVRMYQGETLSKSKVITLHPPSLEEAALVLRIDGETPRSCWTNCMFMQAIELAVGKHKFTSDNFNIPRGSPPNPLAAGSKDERLKELIPIDEWQRHPSLFSTPYKFEFEETLEAGKHYRLNIGTTTTADDWRDHMVIWWQEIRPN